MAVPMEWTSNTKGIAVICYMTEVSSPYGSADLPSLQELWETLGFDVRPPIENPSEIELDSEIQKCKQEINANPDRHDMFCLSFIGHGGCKQITYNGLIMRSEYLKLKNGFEYDKKKLYDKFTVTNFPDLGGKPKLLFLQACRGSIGERPVQISRSANVETTSERSDLYILHSSFPNYESYYDKVTGRSYFIQAVYEVFKNKFKELDLQKMSTMVKEIISKQVFWVPTTTPGYYREQSQTVVEENSLGRILYFHGIQSEGLPQTNALGLNNPQASSSSFNNQQQGLNNPQASSSSFNNQQQEAQQELYNAAEARDVTRVKAALKLIPDINWKTLINWDLIGATKVYATKEAQQELYNAAEAGDVTRVKAALKHKPDINWKNTDKLGDTPLHRASWNGYADIVKLLLAHRAEVDKANDLGWTPLSIASGRGHADVVKLLLAHGAEVNKADKWGVTPLWAARLRNHSAVVAILKAAGGRE